MKILWKWIVGVGITSFLTVNLFQSLSLSSIDPGSVETNTIGMKLAFVPAGTFLMGSPPEEKMRQEEELQHPVRLSRPFRISTTEVTQKQWMQIMEPNRSNHIGDDLPVEKVSWSGAIEFCKRLSKKESVTYRLPTEAEWEYACRAGSGSPFGGIGQIDDMAWYEANSGGQIHSVGLKKPNTWGLFDMHGNVAEWCSDFYNSEYPDGECIDPAGPIQGKQRVVRGGSYAYFPASSRSAARSSSPESYQVPHTGFRVVMEVEEK
jgi:formylglycine-generating enzyme required for sulfatase activity